MTTGNKLSVPIGMVKGEMLRREEGPPARLRETLIGDLPHAPLLLLRRYRCLAFEVSGCVRGGKLKTACTCYKGPNASQCTNSAWDKSDRSLGAFPQPCCDCAAALSSGIIVSHSLFPARYDAAAAKGVPGRGVQQQSADLRCQIGCRRSRVADETRQRPVPAHGTACLVVCDEKCRTALTLSNHRSQRGRVADSLTRQRGWLAG